jgi:ParB/RepB/Spo0J family partition protein
MTRVIAEVAVAELDLRYAALRLTAPAEVARLRASVAREGIRQPVVVATEVAPGKRVLVDGFKRIRVARELGLVRVHAILLALNALTALATMLRSNTPHRGLSALEEGWIAQRLCREHGLTQARAAELLEHDPSWVSQRLRLIERLERELQDDLRLGLLTPAVARELALVPPAQQRRAAEVVRAHGLTSRQAARLVQQLVGTDDPRLRLEVLADPHRFVADERAARTPPDPRLSAGGNELRASLLHWEGAAARLGRSLLTHAPTGLRVPDGRVLQPLVGPALQAGRRTLERLEQLCVAVPEQTDAST